MNYLFIYQAYSSFFFFFFEKDVDSKGTLLGIGWTKDKIDHTIPSHTNPNKLLLLFSH